MERMANNKYEELARAKVQEKRNLVVSKFFKGGYTIAQQLEVQEEGHQMQVTLKGAFHIDTIDGLYNLRDALNVAIQKVEKDLKKC